MRPMLTTLLYGGSGALAVWIGLKMGRKDARIAPLINVIIVALFAGAFLIDRFVLIGL